MGLVNLIVSLGLDASSFQTGLKQAQSASTAFGSGMKSQLGSMFSVGSVMNFPSMMISGLKEVSKHAIETGRHIQSLSDQSYYSTDDIQKMMIVAKRNNIEAEQYLHVLSRLSEARNKAQAGDMKENWRFSRFGITKEEIAGNMSNLDIAIRLGDEMKKQVGSQNAENDLLNLTGVRYYRLLNTLKEIKGVKDNMLIDKETISELNKSAVQWINVGVMLTKALAPLVAAFSGWANRFVETATEARRRQNEAASRNEKNLGFAYYYHQVEREKDRELGKALPVLSKKERDEISRNKKDPTADQKFEEFKLKEKLEAITPTTFKSSADNRLKEIGGYYLGSQGTAEQDLARQRTEYLKKIAEVTKSHLKETTEMFSSVKAIGNL